MMFGSLDALVYFAAILNKNGELTVGDFTSFQFYMFTFLINFMTMVSVMGEVFGVTGTAAAIAEIFVTKPQVNAYGGDAVTQETIDQGNITLDNLKFSYPTKKDVNVLKGISIDVAKNKTVALVGTSGCGKSTII